MYRYDGYRGRTRGNRDIDKVVDDNGPANKMQKDAIKVLAGDKLKSILASASITSLDVITVAQARNIIKDIQTSKS